MDLTDLNVLKQEPNGGSAFTESKSLSNMQQLPAAPPVPPRQSSHLTANTAGSNFLYQNAGYGGFASNPYSSNLYSTYGGLSPFIQSTAGYGAINTPSNSFMRAAEENSRSAFQSIESVVHAFSAVSAMFESTYYAVYNSFRAVVGVADQFYRLKTHLSGIISALALWRTLKYLLRKLLRLLGMRRDSNDSNDSVWSQVSAGTSKILTESEQFIKLNSSNKSQTNWPLIMFLAVVLGGPYLLWKVLNSIESMQKDDGLWMSGQIDHFVAAAEHDFDSVNNDELSFRRGQRIIIAPKEYQPKLRGWLLATVDGKQAGIVPANYIKIMGKKVGESAAASKVNPKKDEQSF